MMGNLGGDIYCGKMLWFLSLTKSFSIDDFDKDVKLNFIKTRTFYYDPFLLCVSDKIHSFSF